MSIAVNHTDPSWDTRHPPPPGAGRADGALRASLGAGKSGCGWETRSLSVPSATQSLSNFGRAAITA